MNFLSLASQSLTRGLRTGLVLAAATTATIMLASDRENDSPWAAINAVAHILDGEEKEQPTGYAPRESGIGVGINGTAMAAWGVLYEGALLLTGAKSTLLTGGLASLAAWVIDYKIVPRRLAPGIETRLSSEAVWAAYAAMAVGFALSPAWNKDKSH